MCHLGGKAREGDWVEDNQRPCMHICLTHGHRQWWGPVAGASQEVPPLTLSRTAASYCTGAQQARSPCTHQCKASCLSFTLPASSSVLSAWQAMSVQCLLTIKLKKIPSFLREQHFSNESELVGERIFMLGSLPALPWALKASAPPRTYSRWSPVASAPEAPGTSAVFPEGRKWERWVGWHSLHSEVNPFVLNRLFASYPSHQLLSQLPPLPITCDVNFSQVSPATSLSLSPSLPPI